MNKKRVIETGVNEGMNKKKKPVNKIFIFIFNFKLQCTSIYRCANQLKILAIAPLLHGFFL